MIKPNVISDKLLSNEEELFAAYEVRKPKMVGKELNRMQEGVKMLVRELYDLLWRNANLLFEADIVDNEKLSNHMNMKAKKFLAGGESVFAQQLHRGAGGRVQNH